MASSTSPVKPISIEEGNIVNVRTSAAFLKACKARCPHWTTIALWTLGLSVMAGLTIRDLRPLIEDYYDDDENMEVQIITRQSIGPENKRPTIYLDIPAADDQVFLEFSATVHNYLKFGVPCLQCGVMANNSFDVWNEWNKSDIISQTNHNETARKLVVSFFRRLIQIGPKNTSAVIKYKYLNWNRPIVYSLASFLSGQSAMLAAFNGEEMPPFETLDAVTQVQYLWLRSAMNSILCEAISMKVDVDANASKLLPDDQCMEMVQGTVRRGISGPMVLRLSPALNGTDAFRIQLASTRYFIQYLRKWYERIRIYKGDSVNSYGLEEFYSPSAKELEEINDESVFVFYSPQANLVEARPNLLRSCTNDTSLTSHLECVNLCKWKHIESICNCRLLAILDEHSNVTDDDIASNDCNRVHYEKCADRLNNASIDCSQSSNCPKACRTFKYDYRVIREAGVKNKSTFMLAIVSAKEPYLEFVMKQKDFPESLVSQIGGVFNFYLGFSGLSIFCFLVYLIDSWRRWREMGREEHEPERVQAPRKVGDWIWKWRWFYLTASTQQTATASTSGFAAPDHKAEDKLLALDQKVSDRLMEMEQQLSTLLEEIKTAEIRKKRATESKIRKHFKEMMYEIEGKLANMVQEHRAERKGATGARINKRSDAPRRKAPI